MAITDLCQGESTIAMSLHRRENRYRFRGGNVRMRPLQEAHSIRVTKNRAPEPIQRLTNCSLGGSLQGDPTIGLCGERTISVEYGKEATVLVEKVACRRLRRVGTGRKCRKCFLWEGIDSGAKFGHKYTGNMKQENPHHCRHHLERNAVCSAAHKHMRFNFLVH